MRKIVFSVITFSLFTFTILFSFSGVLYAVIAAPSPTCAINATVLNIQKTKMQVGGIGQGFSYVEFYAVKLKILSSYVLEQGSSNIACKDVYSVNSEIDSKLLTNEYNKSLIKIGDKINANIKFGGDEWFGGHFLSNINIITITYNFGTATLKNGSRGEAVMELQRFLNDTLNLGLAIDGRLGPKTIAVIKKWQKANGLLDDGLVGAKTKAKMNASVQLDKSELELTINDNEKTFTVLKGQMISITLGNPGDGGYQFDAPQYDSLILKSTKHTRISPTSGMMGDFGRDVFEFQALNTGTSNLKITASRSWAGGEKLTPIFSVTILVQEYSCKKEQDCCIKNEDCKFFGYAGGVCHTPEYVDDVQKKCLDKTGPCPVELPYFNSNITTCSCQSNKCVTK